MKILLLGFAKIAYMPYMHFYLDIIPEMHNIDLIYWDRDGEPDEDIPSKISESFKFTEVIDEDLPFRNKLKIFYHYRKFVLNVLKNRRYDKIVLLHTTQGLTILDYLLLHYRKKYLLDFRDISHENINLYKYLVGHLARNAALVLVSSNAYRKFLPKDIGIFTIHNYLNESLLHRDCHQNSRGLPIRISFWGLVRQYSINIQLIKALGNDDRFEIHYYGRMQSEAFSLRNFVRDNDITNVFFHGQYFPQQRYDFAKNTSLLHNIYTTGIITGNAMGNKYYDGIIFKIPQLCTKGSYMGKLVQKQSVGCAIDMDANDIAEQIISFYNNLDFSKFEVDCNRALSEVVAEQNSTKKAVLKFIN